MSICGDETSAPVTDPSSFDVLLSLARAISGGDFRARTVLARICETVAEAFAMSRVAIFRYLEDPDAIVPIAAYGGARFEATGIPIPAPLERAELFRRARQSGRAVFVRDVRAEGGLSERAVEAFGVRSLLVVPLLSEGRCLGFLVADHDGETFELDADTLDLLTVVGALTAVVVERAVEHSELRRLNELKSEFIALASHELRTPAAVIFGISWTLEERADVLPRDQLLELRRTLFEQAQRMRTLVDQLLDLSRLEARAVRIAPERFRVRERLEELVAAVAAGHADEVQVDADADVEALADAQAFDRIVSNLIANALRYGAAPVRVRTSLEDDTLRVSVEDRGNGVPPEFVPRLFERFARGDETRETTIGAGLGLAIAQSYAQAHGGYITYEDAKPTGARFSLILPAA
jgi:signal transduction histidine kinase